MIRHTIDVRVRYAECDPMQFAHHGSYLLWFEEARIAMLDALDLPYSQLEASGAFLPVLEAHLAYLIASRFDDRLRVEARIENMPRVRFRIDYLVHRDNTRIATGYTAHAFIGSDGKPIRPPAVFRDAMRPHFR